jgi:transcriptional regulator with XRE-family HTH domain
MGMGLTTTPQQRFRMWSAISGKTQADIARKLGKARQEINRLLSTRAGLSETQRDIAREMGVHVEWLRTGDPEYAPPWAPGPMSSALAAGIDQARQRMQLGPQLQTQPRSAAETGPRYVAYPAQAIEDCASRLQADIRQLVERHASELTDAMRSMHQAYIEASQQAIDLMDEVESLRGQLAEARAGAGQRGATP